MSRSKSGGSVMPEAFLGLGSNLGDRAANVEAALAQLAVEPGIRLVARSRLYLTPPWGDADQDAFVNAAALVETTLEPSDLLARCLAVETRLGRIRKADRRWGPRVIDIDIVDFAGRTIDTEELELPHPRVLERAFVLKPLVEIAPDHLIAGRRVEDALNDLAADAAAIRVYRD